jgi:hypothetical protein
MREALVILTIVSTPAEAARLTRSRVRAATTRASRQRRSGSKTDRLLEALRRPRLRRPALADTRIACQLETVCRACDELAHDRTSSTASPLGDRHEFSRDLPCSPVPGYSRRSETTASGSPRPGTLKAYAGSAVVTRGPARAVASATAGSRTAAWPRLALGVRRTHRFTRGPLSTTTAGGKSATTATRPTPSVQPPDRPAPSLSDHPPPIRRTGRLRATGSAVTRTSYLTP